MAVALTGEVLSGVRGFVGVTCHTHRQQRTPAPSVGSPMEGLREPTPTVDGPALAAFTEGVVGVSMAAAEAATAAATDSSQEVIKP